MRILVINSGSSSIKYRLYSMDDETLVVSGKVERIGEDEGRVRHKIYWRDDVESRQADQPVSDHSAGLELIFDFMKQHDILASPDALQAIGHRVVHGGGRFRSPTLIDEDVIRGLQDVIPMAPLHNPANLLGIEATRQLCPDVPEVAVFDTAFHQTLPPVAYRYALPDSLYEKHNLRRFGFHGISHQYVAGEAARHLSVDNIGRLITLHLGNGASVAAIRDGVCIDTSMGMTPLAGLVMGTRCGDVDPSLHFYLARELDMSLDQIESLMNHRSGLEGLCDASDMREVHQLADQGDERAQLAIEIYVYQIARYVGAYHVALGGLDTLVFTAGIGENDARIRRAVCDRLSALGITLEPALNDSTTAGTRIISGPDSPVRVMVIPTNEELEIARRVKATVDENPEF